MIVEGQRVAYAGDTDPYLQVGDPGKVLALSGTAAHVQWSEGARQGQIVLVEQHELVPDRAGVRTTASAPLFNDTLDMPAVPQIQVRATYDALGEDGLVTALDECGHLAVLSEYVEDIVGHLTARLRNDPTLASVLGQLEDTEAEALVGRVASVLLADRLGEG